MKLSFTDIVSVILVLAAGVLAYNGQWGEATFNVSIAIYLELITFIKQVRDSGEE
jgi:hypothetical protein